MKLHSIETRNYRTLDGLRLEFGENYCTISGRNNAGKSSVIRLLSILFSTGHHVPWAVQEDGFDYKEDKTQWANNKEAIEAKFAISLTKGDDPALIAFLDKFVGTPTQAESVQVVIRYALAEASPLTIDVEVNDQAVSEQSAKEIDKRIKASSLLFLYNSTTPQEQYFFGRNRRRMFYEFVMSEDEKKALDDAGKHTERKLRKFARQHTQQLGQVLGRLAEKYDVEVSPPEGFAVRRMPLGINLRDRNVEVPLDDWGSGTQNRTHILMAILQANRIKTTESSDDKITPFVVIEEPESFLHPSAQAEFGRMLRDLSRELGIQILATTHSPYMLNLEESGSNILLSRQVKRGKVYSTVQVDTAGEEWMAPFADHLGIGNAEFAALRPLFSANKSQVLLVEGAIDEEYFKCLQARDVGCERLAAEIKVVPYGGKDTMKNALLMQFVIRNFDSIFVTFDLDALAELQPCLGRLGLKEGQDYKAIGLSQPGRDCIEGILPSSVLASVNGRETDLVMGLGSNGSERKKAKDKLKRCYLDEFCKRADYSREELKEIQKLVRHINGVFASASKRAAQHGAAADDRPQAGDRG